MNHNIFIIKGRNDQGKSTIMQMVALGLFGLESEDIEKKLKDRMKNLISKSTDKCEFEFTIISQDEKIKLESSLRNKQIETIFNGSKKGATYIDDHLKLIYDVPEEPMNKLDYALKSVESNLHEYEDYSQKYLKNIGTIIEKIESFEEKEERLKEEKKLLKQKIIGLNQLNKRLNELEKNLKDLEKGVVVISFSKAFKEFARLSNEQKELEKKIKKLKSQGVGGGDTRYQRLKKDFMDSLINLKLLINTSEHFEKVIEEKDKKKLKEFAQQVNSVMTLKDLDDNKIKLWRIYLKFHLNEICTNNLLNKKMKEEDESQLFKKLIEILEDFIQIDIIIPGTSGKTVQEFINGLEEKDKEIESKISEKIILTKAKSEIDDILQELDKLINIRSSIPKEVTSEDEDDLTSLIDQKKSLTKKMDELSKLLEDLNSQYNSIPSKDRTRYLSNEEQIENEYQETKKKLDPLRNKIKESDIEIKTKKQFIKEYEKITQPPKYDKEMLKSLHETTTSLLRKIGSWRDDIKSLNLNEMKIESEDIESRKLYSALADYFARVLKLIYYENKGWKIKKVDFINRQYEVEEREPISFVQIGTGHTALNSLMARLKQSYGSKKKIVLFDEIGLMDSTNANILLDEIKRQIGTGEVIFALLTKVDDTLKKISFEPIISN